MTTPLQFLRLFTMVSRSSCGPIAWWILARTSSLVTWSLNKMRSILRMHLISMTCILLCSSAVKIHDSQAFRKMGWKGRAWLVSRNWEKCSCRSKLASAHFYPNLSIIQSGLQTHRMLYKVTFFVLVEAYGLSNPKMAYLCTRYEQY